MITIHAVIGGFTQTEKRWHGCLKLTNDLLDAIPVDSRNRVWFQRWKDNWKNVVRHIKTLATHYTEPVQVCIYAYSWGAGWGAMQFAKELQKCDIPINVMVLSDPIYRHPRILLRWLALMESWAAIKVPSNVKEIYHFYQRTSKPQGHALAPMNGGTVIHSGILINHTPHVKMDDCKEWHGRVKKEALRVHTETHGAMP